MTKWLTPELIKEIREYFKPKQERKLCDDEVEEIGSSLADYVETYLKLKYKSKKKKSVEDTKNKFAERLARLFVDQVNNKN